MENSSIDFDAEVIAREFAGLLVRIATSQVCYTYARLNCARMLEVPAGWCAHAGGARMLEVRACWRCAPVGGVRMLEVRAGWRRAHVAHGSGRLCVLLVTCCA